MEESKKITLEGLEEINIYKKIQLVSMDIMSIEKKMEVGKQYMAVADLDVMLAVKTSEDKFRITSIPLKQEIVNSETQRTISTNRDGTQKESLVYIREIKMTTRIVNIDKPDEFIDIESFGMGVDYSDKAYGKASTYARKYALLNVYKIATGADPDVVKSEMLTPIPNDIKRIKLEKYLSDNPNPKLIQQVLTKFAIQSLDELTDSDVNKCFAGFKLK